MENDIKYQISYLDTPDGVYINKKDLLLMLYIRKDVNVSVFKKLIAQQKAEVLGKHFDKERENKEIVRIENFSSEAVSKMMNAAFNDVIDAIIKLNKSNEN